MRETGAYFDAPFVPDYSARLTHAMHKVPKSSHFGPPGGPEGGHGGHGGHEPKVTHSEC